MRFTLRGWNTNCFHIQDGYSDMKPGQYAGISLETILKTCHIMLPF